MSIWVRLGGTTPATELAAHSAPTWERLADGGFGECSFDIALSAKTAPPLLREGTMLEVICGGNRVWWGKVNDYDREGGRVIGRGIQTDAYQIPAFDAGGNVTRDVVTAINTAAATPFFWPVNNLNGISGSATGDSTAPQMVGQLLDEFAAQLGYRWRLDSNGTIFVGADPTTPTWLATPESAAFGLSDESAPTLLVGRYYNGTTNVTAFRQKAGATTIRTEIRDLADRGTLTLAQVNTILDAELGMTGPSWVNGVTLSREQITTLGGTPAFLPSVIAGTMIRAHGLMADGLIGAPWLDITIGKTRYTAGEDSIYIEPAGVVPRTAVDVWAAA